MKISLSLFALVLTSSCYLKQYRSDQPALINDAQELRKTHEAFSKDMMIATQGPAATQAGLKIARMGGNIVDVAAAVSFAIAVERPQSTGIGGGGFMLIHLADKNVSTAIDFREKAPLAARKNMFLDKSGNPTKKSQDGSLAAAVPGFVAGILEAHAKYGKLSRQEVMEPAIDLARQGFVVYPSLAEAIVERREILMKFPASQKLFFRENGQPYKVGDKLRQVELGRTLKTISNLGAEGFYKGWVAQAIVEHQRKFGGLITQKDLDTYKVKFREPIRGNYRGFEILSMPPPSSGGIHVLQMLNILENAPLQTLGRLNPYSVHLTASAMQMAFADRSAFLGDTDFVNVPTQGLISKKYAQKLFHSIPKTKARFSKEVAPGTPKRFESDDTTHFTIMDGLGNVVSSTQTINGLMGSGVVIPKAGFLLNNEMDDFSVKPGASNLFGAIGGDLNAIAPQKRPLSSMSPTIVLKDNKPVLSLGSPNGTRIISCVLQTLLNYLDYKLPLYESIATVRYHHQWYPDELRVDTPYFTAELKGQLEAMGYKVSNEAYACRVQAVAWEEGNLHGASDPRGEGSASGY